MFKKLWETLVAVLRAIVSPSEVLKLTGQDKQERKH
jgi:hypothetical protein